MKVTFIANGKIQLILIPENSSDEALQKELLNQGELEVIATSGPLNILEQSVNGGIVIRPKALKGNNPVKIDENRG